MALLVLPSTLNLAKNLLISDSEFKNGRRIHRYSFYETIVEYGGL